MSRRFVTCAVLLALLSLAYASDRKPQQPALPHQGVIPDEITAVRVAEAVFLPVFGQEEVAKYQPYHAQLKDGVWTVYGTLKTGSRGGTPMAEIQKGDGKVLQIWHSQ